MQVIYVIKEIVNAFYRIVANAIPIDFNTCSYIDNIQSIQCCNSEYHEYHDY